MRKRVMLAPRVPYRVGPAAHRGRVLLRRRIRDIGDRDLAAEARDGGFFDVACAREPVLHTLVQLRRAAVLDRDREAGEVRGERTAGEDVPVVLARVAVNCQPPHSRVPGIVERTRTELVEQALARIRAADRRAAARTGLR